MAQGMAHSKKRKTIVVLIGISCLVKENSAITVDIVLYIKI
jgi:hypothetical protein